jgi:hypothetical protein
MQIDDNLKKILVFDANISYAVPSGETEAAIDFGYTPEDVKKGKPNVRVSDGDGFGSPFKGEEDEDAIILDTLS